MGIRQPTRTATFFAQAKSGAEQQKEAREKLKKPQALGGAASVSTGMVANTTGAQQQETKNVQQGATEVQAQTNTGQLPGATSTSGVIAGATVPFNTPQLATSSGDWWKWQSPGSAYARTLTGSEEQIKQNESDFNAIKSQIDQIDLNLKTATAADQKALLDKKTELEKILQNYSDKLTKENLGQIAGPSSFETTAKTTAQLLSEEGNNVGKLATVFGPRWNAQRYGGLASQIYGKDLEAIQEEAGAALSESERAKSGTEQALKEFKEGISKRKTEIGEVAKQQQDKIRGLEIGASGLLSEGYTESDIKKLYGSDFDKYFEIGKDGKLVDKFSKARSDLVTRQSTTETKLSTAKENKDKIVKDEVTRLTNMYFPKDQYGMPTAGKTSPIYSLQNTFKPFNPGNKSIGTVGVKIDGNSYKISVDALNNIKQTYSTKLASIENLMKNAITNNDVNEINKLALMIPQLKSEYEKDLQTNSKKV